jgi:hypothetical protein
MVNLGSIPRTELTKVATNLVIGDFYVKYRKLATWVPDRQVFQ